MKEEIRQANTADLKAIVSKILKAKDENPKADTSKLEKQLDGLVYILYKLTDEEIAIVEGK
jgi:hypothetical protein